ncbi:HNH endonuclease [Streptomyces violaceoruber]|nr:HNH endonuclease [Streptomyces violaceoruber]
MEFAHIKPYARVRDHTFDNLIALCPTCHARFDRGDIDLKSMQQYKTNLGLLSRRYGSVELQALQWLASDTDRQEIEIPQGMVWAFDNLIRDGLVELVDRPQTWGALADGSLGTVGLRLTERGREAISRLVKAEPFP